MKPKKQQAKKKADVPKPETESASYEMGTLTIYDNENEHHAPTTIRYRMIETEDEVRFELVEDGGKK
jgi:hypothetical protein